MIENERRKNESLFVSISMWLKRASSEEEDRIFALYQHVVLERYNKRKRLYMTKYISMRVAPLLKEPLMEMFNMCNMGLIIL